MCWSLCCVAICVYLTGGWFWSGWFVWLDWEGVIIHDALDNVFFCLIFQFVGVFTSPACKHTQHRATIISIKDEIKYLHTRKQKLNTLIYHQHLNLANTWKNFWQHIHLTIEDKLQTEIQSRYLNLDKKT